MEIEIIRSNISKNKIEQLARDSFGDMVKVVVDIKREIIAAGGELHADGEALLLQDGSRQEDLWGANIYPGKPENEWIEYTALINIRPSQGNCSLEIDGQDIRIKMKEVIDKIIG